MIIYVDILCDPKEYRKGIYLDLKFFLENTNIKSEKNCKKNFMLFNNIVKLLTLSNCNYFEKHYKTLRFSRI